MGFVVLIAPIHAPEQRTGHAVANCFAVKLLASGLVLPALDYCLKCSHAFNLLDSSGSIGVTERTAYILKVRQLAVSIAKAWVNPPDPIAELAETGGAHGA